MQRLPNCGNVELTEGQIVEIRHGRPIPLPSVFESGSRRIETIAEWAAVNAAASSSRY